MDWRLVFAAFMITFLAELGDKTQLAVFSLVSEYGKPYPVFLGASLALVTVSALGTLLGKTIANRIPSHVFQVAAGLMFIALGIIMLWRFWLKVQGG